MATRVVIADDHQAVRESLRAALLAADSFEIAGEAATGRQALQLALKTSPQIVILDLHMPEMDGIEVAARIVDSAPSTAVILQSLSYTAPYVLKALGAGVQGFVAKDDGVESLLRAIRMVRADELYLSPAVLVELLNTTASLFSIESEEELLRVFDREAPKLLQWAAAVTSDQDLARRALYQSFLAYAIARIGSDPIPDAKMWLLLSLISSLYGRGDGLPDPPARRASLSSRVLGAIEWCCALSRGHANYSDFTRYWLGELPAGSTHHLRVHLRNCPSCHLEWCLVGFAHSSARPDMAALQDLRTQLAVEMIAGDLGCLARAWSDRGRGVRRLMASELLVWLGSAASRGWVRAEDASAPVTWASEFLGSRAWRGASGLQTAMPKTAGLAG